MFNPEQKQYILNALDQEIRRTGLQTAAFALEICAMIQAPEPEVIEEKPAKK